MLLQHGHRRWCHRVGAFFPTVCATRWCWALTDEDDSERGKENRDKEREETKEGARCGAGWLVLLCLRHMLRVPAVTNGEAV